MSKKRIIIMIVSILLIISMISAIYVIKSQDKKESPVTLEYNSNDYEEVKESETTEKEIIKEEQDSKQESVNNKEEQNKINHDNKPVSNTDKETIKKPTSSNDKETTKNPTTNKEEPIVNGTNTNHNTTSNKEPNQSNSNTTTNNNKTNNTNNNSSETISQEPETKDEVDTLRKSIENKYGITIKYGDEMGNYHPKGLTPTKLYDKDKIKKHLNLISAELKKYPTGFFKDFSGMPLTIYLVSSVPGNAFAGFTDKEFMNNIKITMTESMLFEYTLNHEIMHYIDAYLEIEMYPNNPYDEYVLLNPPGYVYGNRNPAYNYSGKSGAYFLGDYAQTNVREDRAEVFKMMITRVYKPPVIFNSGEVLLNKALIIDKQIREYFPSAKGTIYWDKYIK